MFTYKFVRIFLVVRRVVYIIHFSLYFICLNLQPHILGTTTGSDHSAMPPLIPPLLTLSLVILRMEIQFDVHTLRTIQD